MKLHVLLAVLLATSSLGGCIGAGNFTVTYECKTVASQILLEKHIVMCANKAPPHSDAEVEGVVARCAAEGRRAVCASRISVPD